MLSLILALTFLNQTAATTPTIKLPPQIFVEPGKPFRVVCETNCKKVRWTCPGIERLPADWVKEPDKNYVGIAPNTGGTYKIEVLGTLADEWAEATTVLVVGQQPNPPPGPLPPLPPGPPVPPPSDVLFVELQRCYTANASPQKTQYRDTLISIYSTAASGALRDPSVTTTAQLFAKLRSVSSLMLPDDALRTCREVLKTDCLKNFSADTPLTDELRKKASGYFEHVAMMLNALK